ARVDALAQLRLQSISETVPPSGLTDGMAYGVPVGAVNDWNLHEGEVAIFSNGGWVFATPVVGWKAFVVDLGLFAVFDGADWNSGAVAVSPGGAATVFKVTEFDHVITGGASSTTGVAIKNGAQVIGVTGRVLADITGNGTMTWELGVAGSTNRYGSGLGLLTNSWVRGLTGAPLTYWSDTSLVLTATGGDFVGGTVRLAIHSVELSVPRSV
ncbi:MAG: DUF2793 domain-containing protein, partial [Paracoccaceae bacterium]